MANSSYLIPIGEGRLMHLAGDEMPALIHRVQREAITTPEELADLRDGGIVGQVLPALFLDESGWNSELDGTTPRDGDTPEAVFERAFRGGWSVGNDPGEPAAWGLWAAEVQAVAHELRAACRPQTEAFLCLHGAIAGSEEPGAVIGDEHTRSGNEPEPLRFHWTVGGYESSLLDRPTYDRLVAELRLVADFYEWVSARGFALIVASVRGDEAVEEQFLMIGDRPEVESPTEK